MLLKSAALALALGLAVTAHAQDQNTPPPEKKDDTLKTAGQVVTQPARDVGISSTKIPPVLQTASENPYAPGGSCTQIGTNIRNLNEALGPDYGSNAKGKRVGIAEAGGRAVVNSIIPFRGVVREVSGAAAADRRLEAAISAGFARRGYLRGLQAARGCKA